MRWMIVAVALAGCSREPNGNGAAGPTAAPSIPASAAMDRDGYVGRWTGVEGMFVDISPTAEPHLYTLTMQWDLDHRGTFAARQMPLELGLDFTRDGTLERLVPSDGAATGLRYLAGKKDCLTVRPGEGYCRD